MIATILVPVGGAESDQVVFDTAFAVATALNAHLDFVHVRIGAVEAALHTPHVGFAMGGALANALKDLAWRSEDRAEAGLQNVRAFCAAHGIVMVDKPYASRVVTARWREEDGDALHRLLSASWHNDLAVMARAAKPDGLPAKRLEKLLLESGRPIIIVPSDRPLKKLGTTMVCWRETSDAARAVSAAMPLLVKAQRVIVVSVTEDGIARAAGADDVVHHLAWHGVTVDFRLLPRGGRATIEVLFRVAREEKIDLMIMGAYGHGRMREALFGGCTQTAIEAADIPIFLMH
jgi:nucleotide-binding universal stress UspA family protein